MSEVWVVASVVESIDMASAASLELVLDTDRNSLRLDRHIPARADCDQEGHTET